MSIVNFLLRLNDDIHIKHGLISILGEHGFKPLHLPTRWISLEIHHPYHCCSHYDCGGDNATCYVGCSLTWTQHCYHPSWYDCGGDHELWTLLLNMVMWLLTLYSSYDQVVFMWLAVKVAAKHSYVIIATTLVPTMIMVVIMRLAEKVAAKYSYVIATILAPHHDHGGNNETCCEGCS